MLRHVVSPSTSISMRRHDGSRMRHQHQHSVSSHAAVWCQSCPAMADCSAMTCWAMADAIARGGVEADTLCRVALRYLVSRSLPCAQLSPCGYLTGIGRGGEGCADRGKGGARVLANWREHQDLLSGGHAITGRRRQVADLHS